MKVDRLLKFKYFASPHSLGCEKNERIFNLFLSNVVYGFFTDSHLHFVELYAQPIENRWSTPAIRSTFASSTKNKMKATTIIIAASLTLSVNLLFAGNDNLSPVANVNHTISLAPTTPSEATFEDMATLTTLAPVVPSEATFEDSFDEMVSGLNLAPVNPVMATIDDEVDISSLQPAVPTEADFE